MISRVTSTLIFAALVTANNAHAQVRTVRDIPTALAVEAVAAAVADCASKGYNVTGIVVDRAGQLKALQRADNAGPHSIDSSRKKAYTALTTKNSTMRLMENTQKNPAAANLVFINDFIALGGGVPIQVEGETIGAIGIGGAPGGHLDEQCAEAGIAKIKDRLK